MTSFGSDLLVELLALASYVLLAAALTAAGLLAEYASLQQVAGGDLVLAAWFAAIGGLLLYAGVYVVGYRKLAARTLSAAT
ncbi:hypothetical protein [Halovivax sp.]|uniref:hypothetical protein n=1 Tax=Halovivax sp. TaxID=1935978 RepID=UPI0025C5AB16|nr:hypothetical protein [Halovivax sp.]